MKMKDRTSQLRSALGGIATKERIVETNSIPVEDTVNRQGYAAYSLSDELRLITMLNTLKIEPQFYRSENETMKELRDLIERIALKDPYFVAQAIVFSRCAGEGMRSISHLAAAILAPFISGEEWGKRFYGLYNKKESRNGLVKGGVIYRVDDMSEIKSVYETLTGRPLSNAMKKGFASVLENLDTYQLAKYSKTVIDIANLAHPNSSRSTATIVDASGKSVKTLDAIMQGLPVSADTWEVANSEAGQEVAKAVKEGKLSREEAKEVLSEAKNDNWEALLNEGKLGIMAALRNIRSMMQNPRKEVISKLCALILDGDKIRKGLILPVYIDLAYQVVMDEFRNVDYSVEVQAALLKGYELSIPNLKSVLSGKTCVIVDCSDSMGMGYSDGKHAGLDFWSHPDRRKTCSYKAGLIAATIAKATGADIVKFGNRASFFSYQKNLNVFALAETIGTSDLGGTNPSTAFELIRQNHKVYDRLIFLSDNEVNGRLTSTAYKSYIHDACSPYIYTVDLAAYGTTPLKNENKVVPLVGYGTNLYDAIAAGEFNPNLYIDKVRKVQI